MPSGTYTSTVGSETTVFEAIPPGEGTLFGYIDLSNLQSGDAITFFLRIKADGANYRLMDQVFFIGPQTFPILEIEDEYVTPSRTLQVTARQETGSSRAFSWVWNVRA